MPSSRSRKKPQLDKLTMVPTIVLAVRLSARQLHLYLKIKILAGDDDICWQSTAALAEACHMSTSEVCEAKATLVSEGLISIVPHVQGSRESDQIKVLRYFW